LYHTSSAGSCCGGFPHTGTSHYMLFVTTLAVKLFCHTSGAGSCCGGFPHTGTSHFVLCHNPRSQAFA